MRHTAVEGIGLAALPLALFLCAAGLTGGGVHVVSAAIARAGTPYMGFSTWNGFKGAINETMIQEIAIAMQSSGLAAAGYVFMNLDGARAADCVAPPCPPPARKRRRQPQSRATRAGRRRR